MGKFDPHNYSGLDRLGRVPLSKSFHFREFLHSEIAVHYNLRNVPAANCVDAAVFSGSKLCTSLLEPIQDAFGRIHVRSGYRSREVNQAGVAKHNCAADNDGFHTWDFPSELHGIGATACISIPAVSRAVLSGSADDLAIAWWIYDHVPDWSCMEFFATAPGSDEVCFNIGWHERPMKAIQTWRGGARSMRDRIPSGDERKSSWQKLLKVCAG